LLLELIYIKSYNIIDSAYQLSTIYACEFKRTAATRRGIRHVSYLVKGTQPLKEAGDIFSPRYIKETGGTTLNFRDVTINDKRIFEDFEYICSDYTFSYILMYSDAYKLKIWDDDRSVIIHSGIDKPCFYMPLGDTEHGIKAVLDYCKINNIEPVFGKIPQSNAPLFKELKFKLKEDRDSFDYIYRNSDFIDYEGKKFRKARNNLYSYLKICTPIFTTDINSHIEECKEFTLKNYKEEDIINPTLRILDNFNHFNLEGGMVWEGTILRAFCIYEKVSPNTIQSHVELNDGSHRGIHSYMINAMSQNLSEEYINKEDDMGLRGLRRFKESYNPWQPPSKSLSSAAECI